MYVRATAPTAKKAIIRRSALVETINRILLRMIKVSVLHVWRSADTFGLGSKFEKWEEIRDLPEPLSSGRGK